MAAVLQINKAYLLNLKSQLQSVLDDVNAQLRGVGNPSKTELNTSPTLGTTLNIPAVDGTLQVLAGVMGSSSQAGFDAAQQLNTALESMGSSVHNQLTWLQEVLMAMESDIDLTVQSFSKTESLNAESVTQLQTDFSNTLSLIQQGPQSSSGGSGGSGG
jgi:hypothetical protein